MFSLNTYDNTFPRMMGDKAGHALKLQQHLYDQFQAQSEFCDVTLSFCDVEVKAHWCVLVSCPYFESFYNSGMKGKFDGKIHINVGKQAAVRTAITFLYTGTVQYSGAVLKDFGVIEDILEVADYLQIDDLKQTCTTYLLSVDVNTKNCIHLCLLASLYDLDNYSKVFDYIRGHLPDIMKEDDILTLTADSIVELVKDKTLNYVAMTDFYTFIVRWVEHDLENREFEFEKLFCELDLKKLPREFLESTVEASPLVLKNERCQVHVLNVKMKHMAGLLSNENLSDVILVVGGCGMGQLYSTFFAVPFLPINDIIYSNNVYGYIINENRWAELAPLPFSMRHPLVAYCNSSYTMYVYDGSSGTVVNNNDAYLYKYNLMDKTWNTVHMTLPEPFQDITIQQIHIVNGKMFIVASGRSAEVRSAHNPQWMVYLFRVSADMEHCNVAIPLCARNMKTEISTCLVDDRYIAVMCSKCIGRNGRQRNVRFFIFDCRSMKQQEYSGGAKFEPFMFAVKNEVFLTKHGCYRYHKFNLDSRRWTLVKDLLVPLPMVESGRTDFLHTIHNNELYVFGGKTGKTLLTSNCKFDLTLKKWEAMEDAPKACINSGVVVAKVPSHLVRCHIDCPHCKYLSVRSQATYQIEYPDDDGDYDDDISYDDDDYAYSDFWENDMDDDDGDYFPDLDWL